jgi:MFS transporter, DHA2 family, multidrug resistance protein
MAASSAASDARAYQAAGQHKWLVTIAVMLGAVLPVFDLSVTYVALPYMKGSFAAGVDEITWVVTSFLISNSVMIPMTGWIASRIGRKRHFITSLVLFMAASALCGVSRTLGEMVVFRLIEGAAGASMMPLAQAILFETFPPAEQTLAMAVFGLGMMMAPILGPTIGGWVTINLSWRWNFYLDLPAAAVAATMVYTFVHDPPYLRSHPSSMRVDYLGIILLTVGLGLLQLVLDRGQRSDWFAADWVTWCTILSAASLALLAVHELRFAAPILELRALTIFGFTLAVMLASLQTFLIYSVNFITPLFTEALLGYDAWKTGLAVAPRGFGVLLALLLVGWMSRRGLDTRPLVGGGFVLGAYEIWKMSNWDLQASMSSVIWPIFLFGLGSGVMFPIITACGLGQIRRERMGYASSLFLASISRALPRGVSTCGRIGCPEARPSALCTRSSPGKNRGWAWFTARSRRKRGCFRTTTSSGRFRSSP